MEFTDVFKPPFKTDPGGYEIYIWCCNGTQMAFNLLRKGFGSRIVALLNGEEGIEPFKNIGISADMQYIVDGYSPLLKVRGWGHLTGGLKLDPSEAIRIQNDFVKWAAEQLKRNN